MKAHVVREMFNLCAAERTCDMCEEACTNQDSCYTCGECHVTYCNACSRTQIGLPRDEERDDPLEVLAGDIFLAGPDKYGIHHVILARSAWQEVEPEIAALLQERPGDEILACETIESTQGSVGDETWWYPATTFFSRDPVTGAAFLIADLPENSEEIEQAAAPVPTKLLLHPFREDATTHSALDERLFEEVIQKAASASLRYGKTTAVSSLLNGIFKRDVIDASEFPTEEDRAELLRKLRKSWRCRPICASVAVMCWQQYFVRSARDADEAVRMILRYMPHWCHKSTPAALVKGLSPLGWVLSDTFDA